MAPYLLGDLAHFVAILGIATFGYLLLIPIIFLAIWCLFNSKNNRPSSVIFLVFVFWIFPIVLSGLFRDASWFELKTARWVAQAAQISLYLQLAFSIYLLATLKGRRWLAFASGVANGLIGLSVTFVLGMDASGVWL
jgi:hypothetical protein